MNIQVAIKMLNQLLEAGIISEYAIGGAVGATFYLEPVATVDLDVFIDLRPSPGGLLLDTQPLFAFLRQSGCELDGEYVLIGGWPVQFLAPPSRLVEDALLSARSVEVEGDRVRVFGPEHLAAIALETGRGKDKARLLEFVESGALDLAEFERIVEAFGLAGAWNEFKEQFLENE
ncbi:MAG: hypothetical protein ABL962_07000 [Fimbriimonadaceae bacterium]